MIRNDILDKEKEIKNWIAEGKSKAYISKELHYKPETLNSYLEKMGIIYKGRQDWNKGLISNNYINASQYIKKNNISSHVLRIKLIKEGIKEKKCEICGLSEWQNKELPLELHHKDGNHYNNDFNNLQILCPNCHSIQEIHSSIQKIKNNIEEKEKNYCLDCGIEITKNAIRCKKCAGIERNKGKTNRISKEELKKLIRIKSFSEIGRKFNVSDNAIRKWCDFYNLPRTKQKIKTLSDMEWELL